MLTMTRLSDGAERPLTAKDSYKMRREAGELLDEARALYAEAEILDRLLLRGRVVTKLDVKRTRICVRCEQPYSLTAEERRFFRSRGLALPRRCPTCRAALRERMDDTAATGTSA